jgi:hypothetical protein
MLDFEQRFFLPIPSRPKTGRESAAYAAYSGVSCNDLMWRRIDMDNLKKNPAFGGPEGPVVLVIMDGVGIGKHPESDYVKIANTHNLDWLREHAVYTEVKAHGTAVGLPDDSDMGNSEVGHNAIGCGRVFSQGAALVDKAIASGNPHCTSSACSPTATCTPT